MTTFSEVLLVNPYDKMTRFEITREEFISDIQYVSEEYFTLGNGFIKQFNLSDGNKNFFFLTGFPGVGKTTFINWLIHEIKVNSNQYFASDTSNIITEYINLSFQTTSRSNYFEEAILLIIKKRFNEYKESLKFIIDNRHRFEKEFNEFISKKNIIEKLLEIDKFDIENEDNFILLWSQFEIGLSPNALILLCLIEKSLKIIQKKGDYCFFCIDNLDALSSEYLLDGFWSDYFKAFGDMIYISEKMHWSGLRYKFKIVFILRQYNYKLLRENINSHAINVMEPFVHENKYFIQKKIEKILEKRKIYAQNKKISIHESAADLVDVILNEDEIYREKLYLPLFNYDIRKINQKIVEISTSDYIIDFTFDKKIYNKLYENSRTRNGARGVIIHSFIKALFLSKEKYPIDPIFDDDGVSDNQGFCSYCRMLMTLIYNLSYPVTKRLDKDLSKLDSTKPEAFSLDRLINALRIYNDKKPIIPYENIFDWLKKFYSIKNKVFTHLIEISNNEVTNVYSNINLDKELNISKNEETDRLSSTSLHDIKISINPSGVVYLRYLVTHFEFMAAYKYWQNEEFSTKFKPLFLSIDFNETTQKYEFEELLLNVLRMVTRKKQGNDKFLKNNIFIGESNLKNIGDYLKSLFTIHLNQSSNQLYSSRMIATHLSYIESFRTYVNSNDALKNIIDTNSRLYGGKNIIEINKFILSDIQHQYVKLCINIPQNMIDDSIYNIMKKWDEKILALLSNRNFTHHIDINLE